MRNKMLAFGVIVVVGVAAWTTAGRAADKNRDWPSYGGDKGSTKYSPLDQIDKHSIKNLRIAWRQQLGGKQYLLAIRHIMPLQGAGLRGRGFRQVTDLLQRSGHGHHQIVRHQVGIVENDLDLLAGLLNAGPQGLHIPLHVALLRAGITARAHEDVTLVLAHRRSFG